MIKVLIVDDVASKIQDIRHVLVERCQIQDSQISQAGSVSSGIKSLMASQYQLLILDLVLPQFDGESPEEKGGLSLLKDINSHQGINLPVQIICLTEFANVIQENQSEFDQLLVSSVVKNEGDSSWIDQLAESVNHTVKLHNHFYEYYTKKDEFDVGIVCALQEEFEQMIQAFGEDKWTQYNYIDSPFQFRVCIINTESMNSLRVIAACAGGAGIAPTATLSTFMFTIFHVKQLYMTGFTGAFASEDTALGDILISKAVESFPMGKVVDAPNGDVEFLQELHQIPANSQLVSLMSDFIANPEVTTRINLKIRKQNLQVRERESYQINIVPTVCVPFVLGSENLQKSLKNNNRKLRGIDMEGFALYHCAHQMSRQSLWIKGVSDMADKDKDDKYHKTCAYGSAFLLQQFLKAKF